VEGKRLGETNRSGFRMGRIENFSINNQFRFYDKDTYPLRGLSPMTVCELCRAGHLAMGVTSAGSDLYAADVRQRRGMVMTAR
jgi:hypothetical protein